MAGTDEVLERALAMAGEGDWEGAASLLREALRESPGDPYLLCWLGVAERELGLEGAAYDTFRRCLAGHPTDPHVLAVAGGALAAFDDPEAEPALRLAALTAPDLPIARLSYGAYLAREGLLDDALRELDAARELAPDDPTVAVERGGALALKGAFAEAADELERAVSLAPEDGWPRVLLGLVRLELDDVEGSAEALVAGARAREDDGEAQLLAALAAAGAGWEGVAYEMLERARRRAGPAELAAVVEAEEEVDAGPEAALGFLRETLAPGALRERLMTRP